MQTRIKELRSTPHAPREVTLSPLSTSFRSGASGLGPSVSSATNNEFIKFVNGRQWDFDGYIRTPQGKVKSSILADTGASGSTFVNRQAVNRLQLPTVKLKNPCKVRLADGKLAPEVTHMAQVSFELNAHIDYSWALVADIGRFDMILGMPWLEQHDPTPSFRDRSLTFQSDHCMTHCLHNMCPTTVVSHPGSKSNDQGQKQKSSVTDEHDIDRLSAEAFTIMASRKNHEVNVMYPEHFELLQQPASEDKYIVGTPLCADVFAISNDDYEKFFAKLKKDPISRAKLKKMIPDLYHEFVAQWDPKEANKLPPHRASDHRIDLIPGAVPPAKKTYGMSREQASVVKAYIEEMLGKDFIRPSHSNFAAPVLIVKKPDGGLRVCVDYRALNAVTIKNRNAPPLIRETLARLCAAKVYTKFDIIAAFNEIRVRPGDEEKTAFITRYGLFEYVVMPFGLCNAPGTFQSMINDILRPYLDDFCTAYLDDILIYSNSVEEHKVHVKKVLIKLKEAGLFLDINKCEFHVTEVKYLGLIITTDGIKMDPAKVEAILEWKDARNVKDVQAFLGFANFYHRFIYNYSKLTKPLTDLTRTENANFSFPWAPDGPQDTAFKALKNAFTTAPILAHWDPNRETWLETDASDYVVAAVLSQMGDDGLLHPVAFMSMKMSPAECNYEIYDKELLAIVRAFEEWHPECAGTPVEEPIKVLSDHKNLEYFMTTKALNRRQARWAEFLSEFNFKITYRPGKLGAKPDSLTRRVGDLPEDDTDERKEYNSRVLLKAKHLGPGVGNAVALAPMLIADTFTSIATMVHELAIDDVELSPLDNEYDSDSEGPAEGPLDDAPVPAPEVPEDEVPVTEEELLARIQQAYVEDETLQRFMEAKREGARRIPHDLIKEGHRLELADCEIRDGLFYVNNRLYVPNKDTLKTAIVKLTHESPMGGHGGRRTTLARLISQYHWPQMTNSVSRYVKTCHTCKRTKAYRDGKHGLLRPLPIPDHFFQDISCDFITPLPICKRNGRNYRHILVVVDRLSKKKRFIPLDFIDVDSVVKAFVNWVWRDEGYPRTIISDRGRQFVSDFWRRLCARLGTAPRLSTAFHPETDGQTENANASLKAYLRAYVSYQQDDWVDWLPMAEFQANSAVSDSTGMPPFLATKAYMPRSGLEAPEPIPDGTAPAVRRELRSADKYAEKLEKLKLSLRESLQWAQAKQTDQANRSRHPAPEFKVGDKVFLDGRNIKTTRPNHSLDYKNLGPYKILKIYNRFACKLELPESMGSVFPTFHPWLLHLQEDNPLPGQIEAPPPAVDVDSDGAEHPAQEVVDSRIDGRRVDPATKERPCLVYKIKYTGWPGYNARPKWQIYPCANGCPYLVADFHSKYPDKPGPHASFARPADWTPQ